MRFRITLAFLMVTCSFLSAWAKPTVESNWETGDTSIDALADEWLGAMTFLDGPKMYLGVRNDDEYLYLCLYSSDSRAARQTMARGLVLQLTVKKGDPFRIQFPIGLFENGQTPSAARERDGESLRSFLLLKPDSQDRLRLPVDNELGIEMRTGGESGSFAYEIKLPLTKSSDHPHAIGWTSGSINLKIDTPAFDRSAMRPPGASGRSMGGGGRGGMGGGGMGGGGRGGMGGGGMAGDRPSMPEPIHIKAKIKLAVAPTVDDPTIEESER